MQGCFEFYSTNYLFTSQGNEIQPDVFVANKISKFYMYQKIQVTDIEQSS